MATLIDADDIDFAAYLQETEAQQKVRPARIYVEDMLDRMYHATQEACAYLPWFKVRDLFQFRRGEMTLWAGINGHGKSLVTGQAALSLMGQGERVCIASFEMKPASTLFRMLKQATGTKDPDMDDLERFMMWSDKNLFMYDHQGSLSAERLYGVITYAAKELKVKHMVIDSLMRVIPGEDSYNEQKDFVTKLCDLAIQLNIHIHLVHHVKKGKEDDISGRYDAKGSGSISDNVHNSLVVWSNKKENEELPDVIIKCDKQREGEWEGNIGLWFVQDCLQFCQHPGKDTERWC